MRKAASLFLAGLLMVGLAGCASYSEVYGKVIDHRTEVVESVTLVGKAVIPTKRTKHYLKIEFSEGGTVYHKEIFVNEKTYDFCQIDGYLLREEDGSITCGPDSWR